MSVIDSLLAPCSHFLRAIFRRDEVERELREELDGYFGMLVEQNLARGMSPRAARRAVCGPGAPGAGGRLVPLTPRQGGPCAPAHQSPRERSTRCGLSRRQRPSATTTRAESFGRRMT